MTKSTWEKFINIFNLELDDKYMMILDIQIPIYYQILYMRLLQKYFV